MNLNASLPLNSLSFGFCSYNILLELYKQGISPNLFLAPDGADLSAYDKADEDFKFFINSCANKARRYYSSKHKEFKLWHINGSESHISSHTGLLTFHEVDALTDVEVNILNNQAKVFVSSKETKQVFEDYGVNVPVLYTPLGFDAQHFRKINKEYHSPDVTVFGIFGKFERRKWHEKAIKAWLKKYANNRKVALQTHIYNPFFKQEQNQQILNALFQGNKPFNVNPIPYVKTLSELNDSINAVDVVIDMSGGEGFSLPSFHCVGLGKHGVIHNCSAMKDWAANSGAVLVNPSGKEEVYDGVFFQKGAPFNQGNIYSWNEDEFIAGCEEAIQRKLSNPVNELGLVLQKEYTWEKTVQNIISNL